MPNRRQTITPGSVKKRDHLVLVNGGAESKNQQPPVFLQLVRVVTETLFLFFR